MLSSIGELPVNSLSGNVTGDVLMAKSILGRINREIQTRGYFFNTEHEYPLARNTENEFILAYNMVNVDVDPDKYPDISPIVRKRKLYDLKNHTYKFPQYETLLATVLFILKFEDLPEVARNYITIRASRIFQDQTVGSGTLHDFTENDELMAKVAFDNWNLKQTDMNLLDNVDFVVWRRSRWL